MVDLPPSIEDLPEYARFAFLNEMHKVASQISTFVRTDEVLHALVKKATDIIEDEKKNIEDLFTEPYKPPALRNVSVLITRCAELYLASGQWFELSRADVHLADDEDKDVDLEELRFCFDDPNLTGRFVISSPIIELTLTRIEMIKYFEGKQEETFKGPDPGQHDPFSKYKPPEENVLTDIQLFNISELTNEYEDPDQLVIDDNEYLVDRENSIWSVLSDIRFLGSLCSIIYYIVFSVIFILEINSAKNPVHVVAFCGAGYGLFTIVLEIVSMRMCLVLCCKPEKEIECIYPGFSLYVCQYIGCYVASVVLILTAIYQWNITSIQVKFFIIQQAASLFWPLCTQCFMFKWHQRIERKFKWIRIKFFKSCWWTVYRAITFIIFTPSVSGVETLLIAALRNKPKTARMKEQVRLAQV